MRRGFAGETGDAVIEVAQVGFRVGGRWALQDVSLTVREGEVFGLAGPNGSGKSLLLAICATVLRPHTGMVRIAGQDIASSPSAVRRVIGYVPEEVGAYPDMTVREDLEFFARAHGMGGAARQPATADALERWGLRAGADVAVRQVSRGTLRRVALARAGLHHPRVLLLDGPESGLDSEGCEALERELRRHIDEGGSVLLASHRSVELARWSHRIGLLTSGLLLDVVESRSIRGAGVEGVEAPATTADRKGS